MAKSGYEIAADYSEVVEEPAYVDAMAICKEVLEDYAKGEIGEIYLAYTAFKNTVSHIPTLMKVLPVEVEEKEDNQKEKKAEARGACSFERC